MAEASADGPDVEVPVDAAAAALARAKGSAVRPAKRASSAGREPQTLAGAVDRLLSERGWQIDAAAGAIEGRWRSIVGDDVAEHVQPESFVEGVLTLRAESTAWATQMRMLLGTMQTRIDTAIGKGVVQSIKVVGPAAPVRNPGPRRVPGRGPRDTYG